MFAIQTWLLIIPVNKFDIPIKEKWQWMIRVCMAVIVWGIFTEIIKVYVPGRSFDLLDWAADSFGAILALLLGKRLFLRHLEKKSID
jgi:VanZ family protein